MAKYLDPKADVTFKKVFGEHKNLVISLLNALLPLDDGKQVESIEYLPPEMVPDNPDKKNSIVDVMVGCRGETPECFEECYEFLKSLPVTQLHVFPYSERPGTAALKIPYVVSDKEKKLRSKRLLELSDQKTQEFYAQYIGTEAEVLFEKAPRGKAMHGFTKNYVRVELSPALAKEEYDNQLLRVRLGDFNHDKTALKAELL